MDASYLNCSFTIGLVVGLVVSSSDIMGAALTPAADSFFADLAASLLVDVERDNPSELLALTGFCNCCTASGLTMILMEDR